MRDESEIRALAVEQERKAAKAKSKEKAAREEGATVQADAYGALASAYWREANLLRWALGDCESPNGNGCRAHCEPEPYAEAIKATYKAVRHG